MRYLLPIIGAFLFAANAQAARPADLSMLRQWTPHNRTEMRQADPVALAYLAKGWLLAGDTKRAKVIIRELDRRGVMAFTAGSLPSLVEAGKFNSTDTVYSIALVQVLDAFREAGDKQGMNLALSELKKIPLVDNQDCWAYSAPDAPVGCIQDIGGISLAILSHIKGWDYSRQLAYEEQTQLADGSWIEWQDQQGAATEDAAHLSWTAFMLLTSPDPQVQQLGTKAATFISTSYDPETAPAFSIYAVAAVLIQAGLPGGCPMAKQLPGWASSYHQVDPDGSQSIKNQMWAAYVYTWAQTKC